ncbi:MAG: hypothetical protein Q2306_01405 [Phytoplasma sp.]|uniref:hypothetical protein n=1 Tax=Phytoplasma sp. TaxID=2155 RepID=UPI002B415A6D|nr:hypothetical protein [Phytoplasma sp.]WRH06545.1 MAG: hypothetical protein Q2306_01405 [Phytoplasma sp.]
MNLKKIIFISIMTGSSLTLIYFQQYFSYNTPLTYNNYIILPSITLILMILISDFYYSLFGVLIYGLLSGLSKYTNYIQIYDYFIIKDFGINAFVFSQILLKHFLCNFVYLGLFFASYNIEQKRKIVFQKFWLFLFLIILIQSIILTTNGIYFYGKVYKTLVHRVTWWPNLKNLINNYFILIIWLFNFVPIFINNLLVGILVTFIYRSIQKTNYLHILNIKI